MKVLSRLGNRSWPRERTGRGGMTAGMSAVALLAGGVAVVAAPSVAAAASSSPAFVQQVSAHGSGKASIAVTTGANVATWRSPRG